MKDNGINNNEYIWKSFSSLNSITILCDLIILIGNNKLWNKLLIGILDIIVLYIRRRVKENNDNNNKNDNGYIIKCMIDILLRCLKMTNENLENIAYAIDNSNKRCKIRIKY